MRRCARRRRRRAGNRHLLQSRDLQVARDELPQRLAEHEMVARPGEAEEPGERTEREHLAAPQAAPQLTECIRGGDRLRTRRDERPVECARRCPDDEVRRDTALIEDAQHAHLDRAQAGTAGEHEGRRHAITCGELYWSAIRPPSHASVADWRPRGTPTIQPKRRRWHGGPPACSRGTAVIGAQIGAHLQGTISPKLIVMTGTDDSCAAQGLGGRESRSTQRRVQAGDRADQQSCGDAAHERFGRHDRACPPGWSRRAA